MPLKPAVVIMAADATAVTWQTTLIEHGLTVVVVNRRGLADALSRQPAAVLLDASLFNGLQEMQAALRNSAAAIYAVMPGAAGEGERVAVSRLPNVKGVYGPDTSIADIARSIAEQVKPVNDQIIDQARPVAQAPNQTPVPAPVEARPVRRQIRLGFYGTRGGVGVSTTALKVAQLIAARGLRVALFDATGRGDLHIMLGVAETLPDVALIKDNLCVFLGQPKEEAVNGYEAIVIDGGRQERAFNTPWITIERLPGDQAVARWAAVEESAPRGFESQSAAFAAAGLRGDGVMLVIGAKGGVGATRVAHTLVRAGDAIALDLADGQLAARLERTTWPLAWLTFVSPAQRRGMIETIVQRRYSLAWSPECGLKPAEVWTAVREVDVRRPIIIDGGIEPPDEAAQQADAIIIVSAESDVARWHARRLSAQYPQATVTLGTKDAVRTLAAQMFQVTAGVSNHHAK